MVEIVVSDLVPLAERGLYQGLIGLVWALASGVGPPIVSFCYYLASICCLCVSVGRRVRQGLLEMALL